LPGNRTNRITLYCISLVLTTDMGVAISVNDFDLVDLMKDLELARNAIDRTRKVDI
jgi:hypothetical protein